MQLVLSYDEARFNLTLLELLKKEYALTGLELLEQDLPHDAQGIDVAGVFRLVTAAIANLDAWHVLPQATLGLFSFAKYLMWKDLAQQSEVLKRNELVRHLLETPSGNYPNTPSFPHAHDLDNTLSPDTLFCPLPADSSQLAAVASAAAAGKDFVLIGPPGTGKSQTITNIIAHCLAQGQSVLFVAEKSAALSVVYSRLKANGLGKFCLELHSHKAKKENVLHQLLTAADVLPENTRTTWERLAQRVRQQRHILNVYNADLHEKHPNGLTLFIAMGLTRAHAELAAVTFHWKEEHSVEQLASPQATAPQGSPTMHTADPTEWLTPLSVDAVLTVAAAIQQLHPQWHTWCAWNKRAAEADTLGLTPLCMALGTGELTSNNLTVAFEVNYCRWWLRRVVKNTPSYASFHPAEHSQLVTAFTQDQQELTKLTGNHVAQRLRANILTAPPAPEEWSLLQRESSKKIRHIPIRHLLASIPTLLPRLAPCMLMSPLSIAQYLEPGGHTFDVVVFDEASQILPWDALGAMARGKRVIVVGDPKQLPPTRFFSRSEKDDVPTEDFFEGDLENILDECLTASLDKLSLNWHYRSRQESLITFSNKRYYDDKLITFPAPATHDTGLRFTYVRGTYDRSNSRTNTEEAQYIVKNILERIQAPEFTTSKQSIGIVTFNRAQQQLIEDLLDVERIVNPKLEVLLNEENEEPLMVKNLENVQGDERDIMYFSLTYGPDKEGKISMNFGPLGMSGGERRLNVAITRARKELHIVSSLQPEDFDTQRFRNRTSDDKAPPPQGVQDFHDFLVFTRQQSEKTAEHLVNAPSSQEALSPLERGIATALQERGWTVHTRVGASTFSVSLGIVHPENPEQYLAGIECDGPLQKDIPTAYDRIIARKSVLQGLGWHIIPVWSVSWWLNSDAVLDAIEETLHALKNQDTQKAGVSSSQSILVQTQEPLAEMEPALNEEKPLVEQPPQSAPPASTAELFDSLEASRVQQAISDCMQQNAPMHARELVASVCKKLDIPRVTAKKTAQIEAMASEHYIITNEDSIGRFFWRHNAPPTACTTCRYGTPEAPRSVDTVPMQELTALATTIAPLVIKRQSPLLLMVKALGNKGIPKSQRERLEKAWNARTQ